MKTAQDDKAETLADPVPAFCKAIGISPRHFYALQAKGEGPPTIRLGRRRLVGRATGLQWLKEREKA